MTESQCNLGNEFLGEQCCCICKFQLVDYWHCTRMPEELKPEKGCGCSVIKGYICVNPEIYEGKGGSSGWPRHSMGCECFEKREDK